MLSYLLPVLVIFIVH